MATSKAYPQKKPVVETRFDVDAAYSSPEQASSSIIQDIRGAGLKMVRGDIKTLLEVAFSAGQPIDDKKMAMEKVVAIAASLPPNSKARTLLTNFLTEGLWKSLQHPPLCYQGEKFEYRMPDGSCNNILFPDLGKAGTPYARSARRLRKLDGVRPDPGLLFDMLMGRKPGEFKENPAGLSSVLFYHASIIIHDIFRTNRLDPNISDTSSYLDLAPLYGSSLEDQLKVRTMERGLLKPDTFHEKRLLGQPPGINIMLIMYNRFHNYVADILLKINEGGRFTLPPTRNEQEKQKALAKQDNDLFQTARLIVGGLYINISLHDYLRGLTNTHHTSSSWTIDPRVEIKKANGDEVARGVGNQVSAEFNLLYRFHSIISQRDEKWLNDFLASLFPGTTKKLDELTPQELLQGLLRWEQNINPDPSKREFDGLKRGPDGKFKDEDLVRIMTESMEAPAGLFGPRMVPKALRVVETLGIIQARKWRMASLNEFRAFFGLKRHETMEDINPDPEIANLLRHLYDSPDMVELYPGLFIEETKPPMAPGNGGCLGFTAGRAVFSDAITLVRSDRFYTIDYTPATLTNWGMQEVQQDYNVMGGSMFYKLFQRALPGWYPYNSLHIMQPMYTWKKNKEIAEELGTIDQFTLAGPKPPPTPVILTKHATICKVLKNKTDFHVPWLPPLNDLFPGKKDYSSFMLGGDGASNTAQRALLSGILYGPTDFTKLLLDTVKTTASAALKSQTFELPGAASQINILKDIAIPVNTIIQSDLFSLDLRGPENPSGTLSIPEMYKHLVNVRTWGFNNNDTAMAFRRRLWAQEGAKVLTETTTAVVSNIAGVANGLANKLGKLLKRSPGACIKEGSLRWYGQNVVKELLAHGKTVEETADIMWLTALAGIGVPVGLFADILQFFLQSQNAEHWEKIQDIVSRGDPTCPEQLRAYVLEAQRMTSRQRNLRICAQDTSVDGQQFKKGDVVICLLGPAGHDKSCIPDPESFKLGRPAEAYIQFGHGPHECLGKEIALTFCIGLLEVVAKLKNLRPAPNAMGELKSIQVGTERVYLDDTWSWLTFDPTSTLEIALRWRGQGCISPFGNCTCVSWARCQLHLPRSSEARQGRANERRYCWIETEVSCSTLGEIEW
ncbi:heme peroxidase [Camillea tinctor]|nr:heme peroxidase [Camillea tinctor]